MEEFGISEGKTIKRLCYFLPPDLKMKIFKIIEEDSKNMDAFEKSVGICLKNITGEDTLDRYFPQILTFALMNFSEFSKVRDIIKRDFLEEIGFLCEEIGIVERKTIDKNNFERFMGDIDWKSREIVWYLLRNRYAGIRELTGLVQETDMEVLTRIRKVINPASKKFLGKEIMEFKESEVDVGSGRKITFKWWIKEDFSSKLIEKKEENLDVFDEPGKLRIVMELPFIVEENDIKLEINNDVLILFTKTRDDIYERRVPLFYSIEGEVIKTLRNRVLEVTLIKK